LPCRALGSVVEASARTITNNRVHLEDLVPITQLQILVGQLPLHLEYLWRFVRAASGQEGTWESSRMHHLLEYFLLGTGFGSTGTSGFGGTTTNTTGSIFGGGTTTGFGGGMSLMFTLDRIISSPRSAWS